VERATGEVAPPLVLINAAGVAASAPLLPPDDDLWARTLAVNTTGAWITSTACLPAMLAARQGFICNVASTAALQGYRYTAAYVASKHAVLGLTRAMACDLEGKGVRVTAVCPGFLDTPMTDRTVANMCAKTGLEEAEARAALAGMNRSGALIDPEDVARAILALKRGDETLGDTLRID
jgi:3-hydroxybutyrate dehydrogenase